VAAAELRKKLEDDAHAAASFSPCTALKSEINTPKNTPKNTLFRVLRDLWQMMPDW
jgi:hypothetical protein